MDADLIFDSGADKHQGEAKQVKHYEINGQLFKIVVSTYGQSNYVLYRFSEAGAWEVLEGKGDTFAGSAQIYYTDVEYLKGGGKASNWSETWDKLLEKCMIYADILKPYKEDL